MNYYKEIKNKILDNEAYERAKDYSKERHKVLTYFEIGRLLHEAGKHYGEGVIQKYAFLLEKDFGKKYDKRTLFRMRRFYLLFSSSKVATPITHSSKNLYNKGNFEQKVATPINLSQKAAAHDNDPTSCLPTVTKLTWSTVPMKKSSQENIN